MGLFNTPQPRDVQAALSAATSGLARATRAIVEATATASAVLREAIEGRQRAEAAADVAAASATIASSAATSTAGDRVATDDARDRAELAAGEAGALRNQLAYPHLARYLGAGFPADFVGTTGDPGTFDLGLGTEPLDPNGDAYPATALDVVRVTVYDDRDSGGAAGAQRGDALATSVAEPFLLTWTPDAAGEIAVRAEVEIRSGETRPVGPFAFQIEPGADGALDFTNPDASGHLLSIGLL